MEPASIGLNSRFEFEEKENQAENPFSMSIDADIKALFEKSLGWVSGKAFAQMNEANVLEPAKESSDDFFKKLEDFEKMINSNASFGKSFKKIKDNASDIFRMSGTEDGWAAPSSPKKEMDLLSLTQEMDTLVEQMLKQTNQFVEETKQTYPKDTALEWQ